MTDKYKQEIYVCSECGSEDVLVPTPCICHSSFLPSWVNINSETIKYPFFRVEGIDLDVCEDCSNLMNIIPKETYLEKGKHNV